MATVGDGSVARLPNISGIEHLGASGIGAIASGKRASLGLLGLSIPGQLGLACPLAAEALALACRAVGAVVTLADSYVFLAAHDGGANTGQALGRTKYVFSHNEKSTALIVDDSFFAGKLKKYYTNYHRS